MSLQEQLNLKTATRDVKLNDFFIKSSEIYGLLRQICMISGPIFFTSESANRGAFDKS